MFVTMKTLARRGSPNSGEINATFNDLLSGR